jgi:hypothetical protein
MQGRRSQYTQSEKDIKTQQVREKVDRGESLSRGDMIIWGVQRRGNEIDNLDMADADWADYLAEMDIEKRRVVGKAGREELTLRERVIWEAARRGITLWRRGLMVGDCVDEADLKEYLEDIVNGQGDIR